MPPHDISTPHNFIKSIFYDILSLVVEKWKDLIVEIFGRNKLSQEILFEAQQHYISAAHIKQARTLTHKQLKQVLAHCSTLKHAAGTGR